MRAATPSPDVAKTRQNGVDRRTDLCCECRWNDGIASADFGNESRDVMVATEFGRALAVGAGFGSSQQVRQGLSKCNLDLPMRREYVFMLPLNRPSASRRSQIHGYVRPQQ